MQTSDKPSNQFLDFAKATFYFMETSIVLKKRVQFLVPGIIVRDS